MKKIADLDQFQAELKKAGTKLVVVDFAAKWCSPCKLIAPKLETLLTKYTNVIFLNVDVDEAEDVSAQYDVKAMPTFKLFKNRKEICEVVGAALHTLEDAIIDNL